jgi:protein TonB
MFDLITGKARHLPSHSTLPIVCSTTAQAAAATAMLVMPGLFVAEQIPQIPTMLAFVAPVPPPPAPAPPAVQRSGPVTRVVRAQPSPSTNVPLAPVKAPVDADSAGPPTVNDGVPEGVEGGVPGGIIGGIVGGMPEPPPPPPPPTPATREPVRIAGQIHPPTLVHRVEPVYPPAAAIARLQGIVLLEALVDRDGTVAEVKVLRSAGSLLDREALIAVRQWRYAPLVLNGHRERFVLTVVIAFSVAGGV